MKMVFTLLVLWPASKCGYCKKRYKAFKKSIFWKDFLKIAFVTYFCFIFGAVFLLMSPTEGKDYHRNMVIFSWAILFVFGAVVPLIIIHIALKPREILNS